MKPEDLVAICRSLNAAAARKSASGRDFIQPRLDKDVLLTNCVFLATRESRLLQISIEEEMSSADAFLKSTGIYDEERLLQLTYPIGRIDYEVVAVFEHWILDFRDEELVKRRFKSLFEVPPRRPQVAR